MSFVGNEPKTQSNAGADQNSPEFAQRDSLKGAFIGDETEYQNEPDLQNPIQPEENKAPELENIEPQPQPEEVENNNANEVREEEAEIQNSIESQNSKAELEKTEAHPDPEPEPQSQPEEVENNNTNQVREEEAEIQNPIEPPQESNSEENKTSGLEHTESQLQPEEVSVPENKEEEVEIQNPIEPPQESNSEENKTSELENTEAQPQPEEASVPENKEDEVEIQNPIRQVELEKAEPEEALIPQVIKENISQNEEDHGIVSDSVEKSLSANSSTLTTERKDENPNPTESQPEIEQKSSMDQINDQVESPPPLAAKKYSSVYMETTEHPLVLIEKHERDINAKIGDQVNLDEKFIVTNYVNENINPKEPHLTCSNLEVVTKNCFPGDNDKLPIHGSEDWGQPKSIAILPQKYIAIGTSKGFILVFNYLFTRIQKFGSMKEREYGAVTSMDISVKEEDVVAIYESGKIVLWSMAKNERIKVIDPPEKGPSVNVKFHKDTSEYFMLTTSSGSIYLYRVEYIFFQWKAEKKLFSIPAEESDKKDLYPTLPSGYFSIQILPKKHVKAPALTKHTIMAMASMKEIIVFALEPTFVLLYRHKRPPGLRDIVTPCISWGRGSLPGIEGNVSPVLAFSWGKDVYLLQVKKVDLRKETLAAVADDDEEKPDTEKVRLVGHYSAKEDVSLLQWVSQNTLATFNAFGEFNILSSGKFNDLAVTTPSSRSSGLSQQAVLSSIPIDDELRYQLFNDSVNSTVPQNSVMFYEHTVNGQEAERQIYLMGKKKMLTLKHLGWQEQLDSLSKKSAWLDAMSMCIQIFKGENNTLAEIPNHPEERKTALSNYAVNLTKKYLDSIEEENRTAPMSLKTWSVTVDTVIDFLISTDNFEFLFSHIPAVLETFNIKELFLEAIEPFILKGRVKSLTNEAFKEVVRFFAEKRKMDTLQYLVINLQTKKIDMDYAIILCMQHNLLTALMYLCSHKEEPEGPDLLTPIASALGKYQRSIEEEGSSAEEYGLKFLWFVHMTLNGRLFPSGVLSQEQWELKVKDIITLLFDEANIDLVLKINAFIAFELLEILFKPTTVALIRSFDENSIKLIGNLAKYESYPTDSKEKLLIKNIYNFITSTQNKLLGQMLGLIYHCSKKNTKYFNHLYYFMANLSINEGCKLPLDVTEETMKYLLENEYEPPAWKTHSSSSAQKALKENLDIKTEERSKLIVGLFKDVETFITSKELEELGQLITKAKIVDVIGHLYLVKKDFDGGFDFYLNQKNPAQKRKVFNWMKEIINRISEQEAEFEDPEKHILDFYNFKESIINHLQPVVDINTEKARKLIVRFDGSPDFEVEVVRKLSDHPTLQLEYLRQVLATRDEYDPVANELLILYIDLLCQFSPKEVANEIRNNNYPIDACLELFKKYEIKDAHALLLERTGQIKDALDIHLELFKESLDKQLQKIEDKFSYNSRGLTIKFENLLRSCTENIKPEDDDAEENWQSVLDSLLEYYEDVVGNISDEETPETKEDKLKLNSYEDLKKVYINYIAGFVEEMSKNVKIRLILKQLQGCKAMKLGEMKDAFVSMLQGHYTEMTILSKAEEQVSLDTNRNMTFLYTSKGEGHKLEPLKDLKTENNREDITAFVCGHAFQSFELLGTNVCPTCAELEISRVTALVLASSKRGLSGLKLRGSPSKSVTGATAKLDKAKAIAEKRKNSEKRTSVWAKPEHRKKCIAQFDRFEEWKDIDMFGWYESNHETKTKKKDSFFLQ